MLRQHLVQLQEGALLSERVLLTSWIVETLKQQQRVFIDVMVDFVPDELLVVVEPFQLHLFLLWQFCVEFLQMFLGLVLPVQERKDLVQNVG